MKVLEALSQKEPKLEKMSFGSLKMSHWLALFVFCSGHFPTTTAVEKNRNANYSVLIFVYPQ